MPDAKITELTEDTSPSLDDLLVLVNDPGGTPSSKKLVLANLWSIFNPPQGMLINGKIVPSVASNNLTVAIKGLNGSDPSATNPVYCRIGDTVRKITSALSVTKNAGTNWFNAGGSELATKEIDYFVYLGYNATDGVVIGFARIPYATEYTQFSTTSTNEKYCAISTITNASSGDDYEVIGRFGATLSAGAGYTWSVPTFTNNNLIQRPIYETRRRSFIPVWTNLTVGSSSPAFSYYIDGQKLRVEGYLTLGSGFSISGLPTASLPISTITSAGTSFPALLLDSGTAFFQGFCRVASSTTLSFSAGVTSSSYLTHQDVSSSVPFTWVATDIISIPTLELSIV